MGDGEGDVPHGVAVGGTRWPNKGGTEESKKPNCTDSPAFLGSHRRRVPATVGPAPCPTSPNLSAMGVALRLLARSLGTGQHPFLGARTGMGLGQGGRALPHHEGRQPPQPTALRSCPNVATSMCNHCVTSFSLNISSPLPPQPHRNPTIFFLFLFFPLFCFLQN